MDHHTLLCWLALVVVLAFGLQPAVAADGTVKPGDRVRVISGPAPIKVGRNTLTTVEAGKRLTALKVQGNWVKVTVEDGGKTIAGWIHITRLSRMEQAPKERVVDLGGGVKMTFVLIPAGTFTMGITEAEVKALRQRWPKVEERDISNEEQAHKVTISKAFWMGEHEVTVGQFRRFVQATAYKTEPEKGKGIKGAALLSGGVMKTAGVASWSNPPYKQTDEHPVVCVTWNDARAFGDWLNGTDKGKPPGASYRLPTEAEWEYACRAGTTTLYQWGDDPNKGKGWCNAADLVAKKAFPDLTEFDWEDGFLYTAPVGSFKANAFGLHDMHGNVYEWCQDWDRSYEGGHQTDPTGGPVGPHRVLRGGAWGNSPWEVRSTDRYRLQPDLQFADAGFRLVLAAGP